MYHKLYIIEGLPCSGKSTVSKFAAERLSKANKVNFIDEGSGNHPADFEFHAFLSEQTLQNFPSESIPIIKEKSERIAGGYAVPINEFCGEIQAELFRYKIYDILPWEEEMPVMLEKWRTFAESADDNTVYVFNCVFLQNPMCETMMRFNFSEEESYSYISRLAEIIKPLNPVVIYLKNDDIAESVRKASTERDGWLDAVIGYHEQGEYGETIGARGFDGYIACLKERQRRELSILSRLSIKSVIIENPQRDWDKAYEEINRSLSE